MPIDGNSFISHNKTLPHSRAFPENMRVPLYTKINSEFNLHDRLLRLLMFYTRLIFFYQCFSYRRACVRRVIACVCVSVFSNVFVIAICNDLLHYRKNKNNHITLCVHVLSASSFSAHCVYASTPQI